MNERMRKQRNAQETEPNPKQSELQNCERRIRPSERVAEKRDEAKSAMGSRSCSNSFLEDDLDQNFEKEFHDKAQDFTQNVFHVAVRLSPSDNGTRL